MREFLIQNKELSLEKIGVLQISEGSITLESGQTIPQVTFKYEKQAQTSPAFVQYCIEKINKSSSIVRSDIEYFLDEARQLMNIGTSPLVIDGLGYIYALKFGGYAFSQDQVSSFTEGKPYKDLYDVDIQDKTKARSDTTEENANEDAGRMKLSDTFASPAAAKSGSKKTFGIIVLILILIGIAAGVFLFLRDGNLELFGTDSNSANSTDTATSQVDSLSADTSTNANNQIANEPAAIAETSATSDLYKFVFESTDSKTRAQQRTEKLRSYGDDAAYDSVIVSGKTWYRLYIGIKGDNLDTTRIKDSLRKYFNKPIKVFK